jgi:hypothetical protein
MNRRPPRKVVRELSREVGFGCPVEGCGLPFLEWHHFDPPYAERNHHDAKGMIALCPTHHANADHGAFSKADLHRLKKEGKENTKSASGKFLWLRNSLLLVAGSNFFINPKRILNFKGNDLISIGRDKNNNLTMNVSLYNSKGELRKVMSDNTWESSGEELEVECPPSGKSLDIKYLNKDVFNFKFKEINSMADFRKLYDAEMFRDDDLLFPLTILEMKFSTHNDDVVLTKDEMRLTGNFSSNISRKCVFKDIVGCCITI